MVTKERLAALTRAIELEVEGRRFYLDAAGRSQNEFGKSVFNFLAAQELKHQEKIKDIYNRVEKDGQWPTMFIPAHVEQPVFTPQAAKEISGAEGEREAIKTAMGLEDDSINYYDGLSRKAQEHFEKKFFAALSLEERGHYLMLLDMMEYLDDPQGWFERKEKSQLEG